MDERSDWKTLGIFLRAALEPVLGLTTDLYQQIMCTQRGFIVR